MQNHTDVLNKLDIEFKKMDDLFSRGDLRMNGQVFRELDEIRRKQIDLASDHIALESIGDLPQPSTENDHEKSVASFNKKEAGLKNLMAKLDDLGASMQKHL